MRPNEMDISRAVQDLEENGSAEDPIFYKGQETTPNRLEHELTHLGPLKAKNVVIGYYGGRELHLIKRGTLSGMVSDRRRLRQRRDEPKKHRPYKRILADIVDAFELEFRDGEASCCIAYPVELKELAREARLALGRI